MGGKGLGERRDWDESRKMVQLAYSVSDVSVCGGKDIVGIIKKIKDTLF